MKSLKIVVVALLTTILILPTAFQNTATAATTTQKQTAVKKTKTINKAVKNLHFNKKTKKFTGTAKANQQLYICSPADKNFGEGVVKANKKGHFTAEWATVPDKIYVYPFNKEGHTTKKITYIVNK